MPCQRLFAISVVAAVWAVVGAALAQTDAQQPTDQSVKPADQAAKPADQGAKPADQIAQPADQVAQPADQSAKPADQSAKPADQGAKSADQAAKPADQSAKPADQAAKPADQSAKPADQSAKPSEQVAKPTEQIDSSKQQEAAVCDTQRFISNSDIVAAIAADLKNTQNNRLKGARYLTLTNLFNICVDPQALEVSRQALIKLLNSLSRSSDVLHLETIDPNNTIIRVNLDDLGWDNSDWDQVLAVYPYRVKPDDKLFNFLAQATATPLPYVRGDWFAFTASQPPLYNKLLKLPADFKTLQKEQGVDVDRNIKNGVALRAGAQASGVSPQNRIIERHPSRSGYFWTTYDFATQRGRQNIFLSPLGPASDGFQHDGALTIFSLPNGFQGFHISNAKGATLEKAPTNLVRDLTRKDLAVTNGISCLGCHDQGVRPFKDEVRAVVLGDRTSFPRAVRDAVDTLYPPVERMDAILDADGRRFAGAMRSAGLDPALKLNGVEIINALADNYDTNVDFALAAAELGLKPEELQQAASGSARANSLVRLLAQGLVPRDLFEEEFAKLVPDITSDEIIEIKAAAAAGGGAAAAANAVGAAAGGGAAGGAAAGAAKANAAGAAAAKAGAAGAAGAAAGKAGAAGKK